MAFSYTVNEQAMFGGSLRKAVGTFNAASVTTGDIKTGLSTVYHISLTAAAAAVGNNPVANETFPLNKGDETIVCDSGEIGTWEATGI